MSHLAISDSAADCPEQSAPCPCHTFQKTPPINAIIAKVPDNPFCHLSTFRPKSRSDLRQALWHLVGKQTKPARFQTHPKCHIGPDASGTRRRQFLYPPMTEAKGRFCGAHGQGRFCCEVLKGIGMRFPEPTRRQERRLSKLKIDKRGGSDGTEEQHGKHPTSSYESAQKSGPQKDINARQSVGLDLRPWTTVGDERR